jgi:hypothetical protein
MSKHRTVREQTEAYAAARLVSEKEGRVAVTDEMMETVMVVARQYWPVPLGNDRAFELEAAIYAYVEANSEEDEI